MWGSEVPLLVLSNERYTHTHLKLHVWPYKCSRRKVLLSSVPTPFIFLLRSRCSVLRDKNVVSWGYTLTYLRLFRFKTDIVHKGKRKNEGRDFYNPHPGRLDPKRSVQLWFVLLSEMCPPGVHSPETPSLFYYTDSLTLRVSLRTDFSSCPGLLFGGDVLSESFVV